MPEHLKPKTPPPPRRASVEHVGSLPADSLDRLLVIARACLGYSSTAGLHLAFVSLPRDQIDDMVLCEDTSAAGAARPAVPMPPETQAFALVPLRDAEGHALELNDARGSELALLVACTEPRLWQAADVEALHGLANTATTELQLRAYLSKHAHVAEELRKYPLHDPHTELANRELFLDRVGQALMRVARNPDKHMAVMSLSVDQFASIETTFGYDVAQDVVRELAKRLKVAVRNVDSVARLAGDEFGVLLEQLRADSDAARVANRIHDVLRTPIVTSWSEFMLSVRIGAVLTIAGADSPARLIQLARLARDRAGATGAAYEIFDPDMQARAQLRLHKEMELRRAVEGDEFDVHYQPIISLKTGHIAKMEALVRWKHPTRGLLPAAEFIGLAEETGLVVPLSWTIVARGCQQLQDWIREAKTTRDFGVSVNITAAHVRNRELCNGIKAVLDASGLPERCLNLEVTEGTLIGDVEVAKKVLGELRAIGVGIHLDDFGTGYSSLHVLHELPLDAIKIDRKFIARLGKGGGVRDTQVVSTIRELARQMQVPVIAEGVETKEQLDVVRRLNCEFAQGYLFSRAIPANEMAALLTSKPRW